MIFLATPCYGGVLTQAYFHSVLSLVLHGVRRQMPVVVETLARESLITRGRNTLVSHFLDTPGATHLLFVDSDIGFPAEAVDRMLAFDEDVVGGAYPLKGLDWDADAVARARAGELISTCPIRYVGVPVPGAEARDGFVPAEYAGTGFMLIKREAIFRLLGHYPELHYEAAHTNAEGGSANLYALFDCVIDPETRHYLSEDFAFCRRWRAIGGTVWLDTRAVLTHVGPYAFRGDPAVRYA